MSRPASRRSLLLVQFPAQVRLLLSSRWRLWDAVLLLLLWLWFGNCIIETTCFGVAVVIIVAEGDVAYLVERSLQPTVIRVLRPRPLRCRSIAWFLLVIRLRLESRDTDACTSKIPWRRRRRILP